LAGLTATLAGGRFSLGDGTLQYIITGAPFAAGTAQFALNIGGKMCTLSISVVNGDVRNESNNVKRQCGAYVAPGEWKEFMCHNLGVANPEADPFTPSWEINGGYWQWGRKEMAAAGPIGPSISQTNNEAVGTWDKYNTITTNWSDQIKAISDPCPIGYKIPSKKQWDGIAANNTYKPIGSWADNPTNYSSGAKLGNNLFLPAAGLKSYINGSLFFRGRNGFYWTSTISGENTAWGLYLSRNGTQTNNDGNYQGGRSVRCIAE
jgi:uncharacterized protein (TIGR02145 family)